MTQPKAAPLAGEQPHASSPSEPKNTWIVFAIIGVLLLLIIGFLAYQNYAREQQVEQNRYNGFDFAQTQSGFWVTRIQVGEQPYDIPFYYHPSELEDIEVDVNALAPIFVRRPQRLYIALDPDAGSRPVIAGVEISRLTGEKYQLLRIPTQAALTRPADRQVEVPIVNCNAVPVNSTVIQFVQHETTNAIVADEGCIYIFYVTPDDSIRVADRFSYELLQIM